MPEKPNILCPDCGKSFKGLAIHRRFAHGVKGKFAAKHLKQRTANEPAAHSKEETINNHIAYIFGFVQGKIEGYAASVGLPVPLVTDRVARLLDNTTNGEILGDTLYMPPVRRKAA